MVTPNLFVLKLLSNFIEQSSIIGVFCKNSATPSRQIRDSTYFYCFYVIVMLLHPLVTRFRPAGRIYDTLVLWSLFVCYE